MNNLLLTFIRLMRKNNCYPGFSATVFENAGYLSLPNGLLFQWGKFLCPATGTTVASGKIIFPVAFPSAVLGIATTYNGSPTPNFQHCTSAAQNLTPSSFTMWLDTAAQPFTNQVTGWFIAIGN